MSNTEINVPIYRRFVCLFHQNFAETGLGSLVGRVSGGIGFDPGPSLTMVLVAPRLALGFSG